MPPRKRASRDQQRRPILLIVNPVSGRKMGSGPSLSEDPERLEPRALEAALTDHGLEVRLHELAETDDLARLTTDAAEEGSDVVIAGGDGTVGKVAEALVGSDATLGILALGSFNNVAHGFGVPTALDPALEAISAGRVALMDAGLATRDGASDSQLFFEAAGVGVDAIGFMAIEIAERRGWRGWWRALKAAWRGVRRRKSAMKLTIDDRRYRVRSPAVSICNGPYHGLGFAIAPDADPTDGQLDVAVFRHMTQLEVLRHFLAVARRGKRKREPRLHLERARKIRVEAVHGTLPAHADGQSIGTTPVTFSVRPQALRIFR